MKFKYDAISFMHNEPIREERYVFNVNEWDELVRDIDTNISDRYYLLNRKILEKWIWVKELRTHPKSIEIMPELRRMLVKEYNAIIEKYLKGMPDIVPKISPDSEVNVIENPEKNNSTPK